MLERYFESRVAAIEDRESSEFETLEEWQSAKPQLKGELLEMLGLAPLPEKTPLNARVTGEFEHDGIVVEKVVFESQPQLYVTGNLYRPANVDEPLPTILYVCGHARVEVDGVPHGNKVGYHHHGAWFARNGYGCLTIDTIQLGEIAGEHHGTYRLGKWWWMNRGYTPEGVEAWNGVRAIDYLATRPEVDIERLGITGRSGGGAYSWFTAAIDERIKAVVPVAGITDLRNHVLDGCVEGHCDCMYFVNTYRWDYPKLAALIAPRPLLLSNSDADRIFPLDGVVRTHSFLNRIYDLYDAEDKLGLLITPGPHKDTQELRTGAFGWFNRYLKQDDGLIDDPAPKLFEPQQLKVLDEIPSDEVVTSIDESFVANAIRPTISGREDWDQYVADAKAKLRKLTFAPWAERDRPAAEQADQLPAGAWEIDASKGTASIELAVDDSYRLPMRVTSNGPIGQGPIELLVCDEEAWDAEQGEPEDGVTRIKLAPRGIGPTAWREDEKERRHIRRRFYLIGETLDAARIHDARTAIRAVRNRFPESELNVTASGSMAGVGVYAALLEPGVDSLTISGLEPSDRSGPYLLNVSRVWDNVEAITAVATNTPVTVITNDPVKWQPVLTLADRAELEPGSMTVVEQAE